LDQDVVIASKVVLGENLFVLALETREKMPQVRPGQFVLLRTAAGFDPLLGRPFAICGQEDNWIEVLFAVAGRGTRLLADSAPGVRLSLRGPLGNGFPEFPRRHVHCLAGGVGIAPFLLAGQGNERTEIHLGVPGLNWKPLVDWVSERIHGVHVYSEEGKLGKHGNPLLCIEGLDPGSEAVWACGPTGMLKAVSVECGKRHIPAWVSLETRMACGMGGCHGCVVQTVNGPRKTCTDGPVFPSQEVLWNAD
jgi:dihydroorotate dehydrogenase electron transfer subunit